MAYRFDFAISYSGKQRQIAERVNKELTEAGFKVFYDKKYEHEMLGSDGVDYLKKVYLNDSKYCIVLIAKDYDQSYWTRLERESIQSKELNGEHNRLIPIKTEGYAPSWLLPSKIYFDLESRPFSELIHLITKKYYQENCIKTLLWVDDNPKNNTYLRKQISDTGISVTQSTSTSNAIRKLKDKKYDAIISDLGRYEADGYNPVAGIELFKETASLNIAAPFIIFCAPKGVRKMRAEALSLGVKGITASRDELFDLLNILPLIDSAQ